jgi:hypothetical protein
MLAEVDSIFRALCVDCSQDLHSGQRTETSPETFGLFFSGYHIVHGSMVVMSVFALRRGSGCVVFAALNDLIYAHGMGEATDIVVSGDSAGGIGAGPRVFR